jgi:hypothetical protein
MMPETVTDPVSPKKTRHLCSKYQDVIQVRNKDGNPEENFYRL